MTLGPIDQDVTRIRTEIGTAEPTPGQFCSRSAKIWGMSQVYGDMIGYDQWPFEEPVYMADVRGYIYIYTY